ncbi:hypothetical protein FNU76_16580 [Chitinimonas arctica]|uniref:DUF4148 domain-containing protein n=1 Tax=Chitinimonas arctica TaxID=2594795 RepID=A0A516SI56_9NEIS|nr:hypothetical protein [Chitinimonas arctica]QDQ27830.1 hypothetical protein FNU76_16580 [Chitinimonas arctica]
MFSKPAMFRAVPTLLLTFALSAALAGPPPPMPNVPPAEMHERAAERMQQRFLHREARIREAVERGDLTPAEAALLRQRLEMHRQRVEYWRQRLERSREEEGATVPPPVVAPPALPPRMVQTPAS